MGMYVSDRPRMPSVLTHRTFWWHDVVVEIEVLRPLLFEITLGKVNKPLLGAISAWREVSAHDWRAETPKGTPTHAQTPPVVREARL